MHDYSEYSTGPSSNLKVVLQQLADELIEAEEQVRIKEEELAQAKGVLKDIAEKRIPEATEGMDGTLDLGDGRKLVIKEEIRASIAGDKKYPAIRWLDDHGYGNIVKRKLELLFEREEEQLAKAVMETIRGAGFNVPIKEDHSVHWQTLVAWVKEQLSEGVELPTEVFGIYRQRTAKVKE